MFYHDRKLRYPVEVEERDPIFAKTLQQANGGVEGDDVRRWTGGRASRWCRVTDSVPT